MDLRATIYLANVAGFFHTRSRSTDLNQAEAFPARFFVFSGPAIPNSYSGGMERKSHDS